MNENPYTHPATDPREYRGRRRKDDEPVLSLELALLKGRVAELEDRLSPAETEATDDTLEAIRLQAGSLAGPGFLYGPRADQAAALLGTVDTIKATGGTVELNGVRIEPCDEYGRTPTTDRLERLEAVLFDRFEDAVSEASAPTPADPAEYGTDRDARHHQERADPVQRDRDHWRSVAAARLEVIQTTEAQLDAARREPRLGCATTRQLIAELEARAHVSETIGEKWTSYRTVDSE